jgi:hypothetical protein
MDIYGFATSLRRCEILKSRNSLTAGDYIRYVCYHWTGRLQKASIGGLEGRGLPQLP